MASKNKDKIYQNELDNLARDLLEKPAHELQNFDEHGSLERTILGKSRTIAFWHWKLNNDKHHIVFITERRIFIFYRKYIAGIVFEKFGSARLMTQEETAEYD